MPVHAAPPQERRRFPRGEPRFGIQLLQPQGLVAADSVNVSRGGLCLRLSATLEVRSVVRLQMTQGRAAPKAVRPVECTGRVAWVIQRLDLRDMPPFLYDVGIEFVDPPPILRQFILRNGGSLAALVKRAGTTKPLESAAIRGRTYLPRLGREPGSPHPWHLVVLVEGTPCFSGHYASERAAVAAWNTFKRQKARR